MPEPSITTPFLTTRSYGIVRSSHPGPTGHARRRRIVLRCSGRREAGTAVGGLPEVRAGDVVAGAARPGHTAGGVPWVRRGSVRPRAIAMLWRGREAGTAGSAGALVWGLPGAGRGSGSRGRSQPREPEALGQGGFTEPAAGGVGEGAVPGWGSTSTG